MSLNIIAAATRNYVKSYTLIFSEFPKLSRILCKHFHLISTYMAQRSELQPLFHHSQQYFYNVLEAVAVRKFVVSYASTSFFFDKCWPSLLAPASSGSGYEILVTGSAQSFCLQSRWRKVTKLYFPYFHTLTFPKSESGIPITDVCLCPFSGAGGLMHAN